MKLKSVLSSGGRFYSSHATLAEKIQEANSEAVRIITSGDPYLVDVRPAREVIPVFQDSKKVILHAGCPLKWNEMSGAMKGAVIGMALYEKWATSPEQAIKMLARGDIHLDSAHIHGACGPLAGTISPSCPVWVVENRASGNLAFARPAEPHQGFGHYTVLEKLNHLTEVIMPAIGTSVRKLGGIRMNPIIQRALDLGDDFHVRNMALCTMMSSLLAEGMLDAVPNSTIKAVLHYFSPDFWVQFFGPGTFVGLAMATAKSIMDPVRNIEYCTLVTCMSRNGTKWGMNVSALEDAWFTAPAPLPDVNFLPGFSHDHLGPDMGGDSSVCEALGLGSSVLCGATALMRRMPHGMKVSDTLAMNAQMDLITTTHNPNYQVPVLDCKGAPTGLDIIKVLKTGITPWHVTGAVHKDMNHKIIGQGLSRAPIAAFESALEAFAKKYNVDKKNLLE